MANVVVAVGHRVYRLDIGDILDEDEVLRGLRGEPVSHTNVRGWLDQWATWLPVTDHEGGRVRRDAVTAMWRE